MVKSKNKKSKNKNNGINLSAKEKACIKDLREILKKDLGNELINNICDDILNTTEENITIFKNDFSSRRTNFDNAFNELYRLEKITSLDDFKNISDSINLLNAIPPTTELVVESIFNDAMEYLDEIISDIYEGYLKEIVVGLRIENYIIELINKELKRFRNLVTSTITPLLDEMFNDLKIFSKYISCVDLDSINNFLKKKNKIKELLDIQLFISDKPLKMILVEEFIVEVNSVSIKSKTNFQIAYDTISNMEKELKERSNSIFTDHDIIIKNNFIDNDLDVELSNDNSIKLKMNNSSSDKNYSWQELNAIAIKNGFTKDRNKGDHGVFKKRFVDSRGIEQERVVVVPQGRAVGLGLQKRVLKDLGILR